MLGNAATGVDGYPWSEPVRDHEYVPGRERERELPSRRVEADMRRRLDAGEWDHGQALPPVSALATGYGVSRNTVAKALRVLADEGLIEVVPNWGTFRT